MDTDFAMRMNNPMSRRKIREIGEIRVGVNISPCDKIMQEVWRCEGKNVFLHNT